MRTAHVGACISFRRSRAQVDPQDSVVFVPPPPDDQVAGQPKGHAGGVIAHIGRDPKTKMNAILLNLLHTDSMQG